MPDRSKPSDIALTDPPFPGTFLRAEAEQAAALLVRCCQVLGDYWQPISFEQLRGVMEGEVKAGTFIGRLALNHFFKPKPSGLIVHRWARRVDASTVELTDAGLDLIEKWSRRRDATAERNALEAQGAEVHHG